MEAVAEEEAVVDAVVDVEADAAATHHTQKSPRRSLFLIWAST